MPERTEERTETIYVLQDHPWVEMPVGDSMDEAILYSLDEIRLG